MSTKIDFGVDILLSHSSFNASLRNLKDRVNTLEKLSEIAALVLSVRSCVFLQNSVKTGVWGFGYLQAISSDLMQLSGEAVDFSQKSLNP